MEDIGQHISPLVFKEAKDFSLSGKAYKKMLKANAARTEESASKNSQWAPGALRRLKAKNKRNTKEDT